MKLGKGGFQLSWNATVEFYAAPLRGAGTAMAAVRTLSLRRRDEICGGQQGNHLCPHTYRCVQGVHNSLAARDLQDGSTSFVGGSRIGQGVSVG